MLPYQDFPLQKEFCGFTEIPTEQAPDTTTNAGQPGLAGSLHLEMRALTHQVKMYVYFNDGFIWWLECISFEITTQTIPYTDDLPRIIGPWLSF